jgi:hypothetical protein
MPATRIIPDKFTRMKRDGCALAHVKLLGYADSLNSWQVCCVQSSRQCCGAMRAMCERTSMTYDLLL